MSVSLENEIEFARNRVIDGPYPEFAVEMRRLLGHDGGERPYISARTAQRITKVNHCVISDALRGCKASPATILKLAQGLDANPAHLMRLSGHDSALLSAAHSMSRTAVNPEETEDETRLLDIYRELRPKERRLLLSLAEAVQSGQ